MQTPLSIIAQIKKTRSFIIELAENLSTEQLNQIPAGFTNNIIWNIAHLTATQQNMCYVRSGSEITVEDKYFTPFLSGTKPTNFINTEAVDEIFKVLLNSVDRFASDYTSGIFIQFESWDKRYGMKLNSIEDAINFVPFHEGMHLGYIMALKRMV